MSADIAPEIAILEQTAAGDRLSTLAGTTLRCDADAFEATDGQVIVAQAGEVGGSDQEIAIEGAIDWGGYQATDGIDGTQRQGMGEGLGSGVGLYVDLGVDSGIDDGDLAGAARLKAAIENAAADVQILADHGDGVAVGLAIVGVETGQVNRPMRAWFVDIEIKDQYASGRQRCHVEGTLVEDCVLRIAARSSGNLCDQAAAGGIYQGNIIIAEAIDNHQGIVEDAQGGVVADYTGNHTDVDARCQFWGGAIITVADRGHGNDRENTGTSVVAGYSPDAIAGKTAAGGAARWWRAINRRCAVGPSVGFFIGPPSIGGGADGVGAVIGTAAGAGQNYERNRSIHVGFIAIEHGFFLYGQYVSYIGGKGSRSES